MADEYEITEADIDSVISYLKIIDPKRANPETAIAILERLHARALALEHFDADAVENILQDLEQQ